MITIKEYVKPSSVAEAYSLLTTRENPAVIGGGFFLRLASRKIGTAIDLSRAGLDFIRETEGNIEIGAMTTFRRLEQDPVLQRNFDSLIPATVANLPGGPDKKYGLGRRNCLGQVRFFRTDYLFDGFRLPGAIVQGWNFNAAGFPGCR